MPNPDYPLALEAAQMATKFFDSGNPDLNETLAEAYFKMNDVDRAVKYQELVVEAHDTDKTIPWSEKTKSESKAKLDAYRAAEKSKGAGAPHSR